MYNAVILAGGKTPWLQKAVGTNIRALAPLGGRRMVEYIIDALDQSGQIGRIIVAADGSQWEAAVLPQRAEPWNPVQCLKQLQLQLHYCLQTVKFYLFVTIYLC